MSLDTIWNAMLTLAVAIISGALVLLRDSLRSLHENDEKITNKLQEIEVLVAGEYVRRDDLKADLRMIFDKLDEISAKMESKVGREEWHAKSPL